MNWNKKRALVTGGASFIGSALVDALVDRGAVVRVVDTFSGGRRENLSVHLNSKAIEIIEGGLLDKDRKKVAAELDTLLTRREATARESSRLADSDATSATVTA
jgi:UDP-glucose 4-epimerase